MTLARPASLLPLRATARDLRLGSGLTANRINLPYASELYLAPTFLLRSPRPALCYRPLLTLLPNLAIRKVTPLEPRTPHQPEKLKKLSKNDLVVLLLFLSSIKNPSPQLSAFSIECSPFTAR